MCVCEWVCLHTILCVIVWVHRNVFIYFNITAICFHIDTWIIMRKFTVRFTNEEEKNRMKRVPHPFPLLLYTWLVNFSIWIVYHQIKCIERLACAIFKTITPKRESNWINLTCNLMESHWLIDILCKINSSLISRWTWFLVCDFANLRERHNSNSPIVCGCEFS